MSKMVVPDCGQQDCTEEATFIVAIDGDACENVLGHSHDPDSEMYSEEYEDSDIAVVCLNHLDYVLFDCPSKASFSGNIEALTKQAQNWPSRFERLTA